MTDTELIALLDDLDATYTATITDLTRKRSEVRRRRALLSSARHNAPQPVAAPPAELLDPQMRETQETRYG